MRRTEGRVNCRPKIAAVSLKTACELKVGVQFERPKSVGSRTLGNRTVVAVVVVLGKTCDSQQDVVARTVLPQQTCVSGRTAGAFQVKCSL